VRCAIWTGRKSGVGGLVQQFVATPAAATPVSVTGAPLAGRSPRVPAIAERSHNGSHSHDVMPALAVAASHRRRVHLDAPSAVRPWITTGNGTPSPRCLHTPAKP
jgi:hypothetical protein